MPQLRRTLPSDRITHAVVATQVLCLATIGLAWLHPGGRAVSSASSIALLLAVGLFAAGLAIAARRAVGTRRLIYLGLLGAVGVGLLAQGYNAIAHVMLGEVPRFPSPGLWLVLLGTHPCLMLGYAAAIGRRRRAVRFETLVDTLLLTVAAATLGILLSYASNWPGAAVPRVAQPFVVLWQVMPPAELILLALLLAARGEALGVRTSAGLTLGTLALGMATIAHVRLESMDSAAAVSGSDPLWALAIFCFSIGVSAPSERDDQSGTFPAFRIGTLRGRFVVVAILISAGSALVLGFRRAPSPELGIAAAVFGLLLAARAAQAIAAQERETKQLSSSVMAERELSALLEQRVGERTAQLGEAQRVLQRMLTLGQQITTELQPERVLQRFVEATVDVVRADGGALGILHDDSIRIAAATGTGAHLTGETIPVRGSAMGRVARTGRIWVSDDLLTSSDGAVIWSATRQQDGIAPARGMAVVPVTRRGERIGAVSVVSVSPRHFSPKEIARIEAMADMLAVALANAELVETLRQAEWRFRTLFRAAPDAVLTVLQSGRVREANDAVRDIAGVDPLQMPGRLLADLVAPDDRERLGAAVASAFEGTPTRLEVRFTRPDGAARLVALAASRVPEADPPTVLLIGRDTTAEREMRARLMETERLAAVGELVAGVAHEVNNPLSSISAFAQLLLRDQSFSSEHRESIDVIRSEAMRAAQVVKDLLAFARRSDPQREPLDLNTVVERSLRLRGYQLQSSGVALEQSLASDLPAVVGDARQLQQVVINLVTNAVQAMAQIGGGVLRLTTREERGRVLLEVADTGPGIDPRVRARIFEPFVTTKQEGEGTGLGLSVTYGIVAAHGGTIGVQETGSTGTTFVVSLPAAPAAVAAVAPAEAPRPSARSPLAGIRLLFVDDEAALRSGMEAFGRMRGFTVVTAAEGRAALEAVEETSFDAVVCDLRMPGMDGFAFHEVLRKQRPGLATRTIFITGDVMTAAQRGVPATKQPVITKPFAFERLEEVLVAIVRGLPVPKASNSALAV